MLTGSRGVTRFRSRKEAERVLSEIVADGGRRGDYRIDEASDGTCVIIIFENDGSTLAGTLGA